nr:MAG TPA: hypothetical protein [Caudoviricetes sp.]
MICLSWIDLIMSYLPTFLNLKIVGYFVIL